MPVSATPCVKQLPFGIWKYYTTLCGLPLWFFKSHKDAKLGLSRYDCTKEKQGKRNENSLGASLMGF